MSKAIEDALNRLSPQARANVEKDLQDFKQHVPSGTMKDVDQTPTISNAPYNTPANTKEQKLPEDTRANIESVNQGRGNNYLMQKTIDKAASAPAKEPKQPEREPEKER